MFRPYPTTRSNNAFRFVTDAAVAYWATLDAFPTPGEPELAGRLVSLAFEPDAGLAAAPPHDERIAPTLAHLVAAYFANFSEGIIQYTCESSDGRALMRQRFFARWLREYDRAREYNLLPFAVGQPTDDYYAVGGFILRRDSPTFAATRDVLAAAIAGLNAAKQ